MGSLAVALTDAADHEDGGGEHAIADTQQAVGPVRTRAQMRKGGTDTDCHGGCGQSRAQPSEPGLLRS